MTPDTKHRGTGLTTATPSNRIFKVPSVNLPNWLLVLTERFLFSSLGGDVESSEHVPMLNN